MEIRQATAGEIPYLKSRLAETEGEQINLDTARIWVAVEGDRILGMLPIRLVWQAEPLLIFAEVEAKSQRRRAGIGLYHAATNWIGNRVENRTGIHWLFGITRCDAVGKWLKKLGWFEQYIGAETFIKHL